MWWCQRNIDILCSDFMGGWELQEQELLAHQFLMVPRSRPLFEVVTIRIITIIMIIMITPCYGCGHYRERPRI